MPLADFSFLRQPPLCRPRTCWRQSRRFAHRGNVWDQCVRCRLCCSTISIINVDSMSASPGLRTSCTVMSSVPGMRLTTVTRSALEFSSFATTAWTPYAFNAAAAFGTRSASSVSSLNDTTKAAGAQSLHRYPGGVRGWHCKLRCNDSQPADAHPAFWEQGAGGGPARLRRRSRGTESCALGAHSCASGTQFSPGSHEECPRARAPSGVVPWHVEIRHGGSQQEHCVLATCLLRKQDRSWRQDVVATSAEPMVHTCSVFAMARRSCR